MINLSSFGFEKEHSANKMFEDTLARQDFILGQSVKEFESAWADYCNQTHCVAVASCTDALRLTLQHLGVGPNTSVVTTPFTWISTLEVIKQLGADIILVDVDKTWCIDCDQVESAINTNTKAIIGVDIFGQQCNWTKLNSFGIPTVCDAAQSAGLKPQADYTCYSFYPTKNLSCMGDGGAVVSNKTLSEIASIRNHGQMEKFDVVNVGWNSRLDSIQAELLLKKMPHLDKWNEKRCANAKKYKNNLSGKLAGQPIYFDTVYHQFVILTQDKHALQQHLAQHDIQSRSYYDPLPCAKDPYTTNQSLPKAEHLSKHNLAIPVHQYLTDQEINHIINTINDFI